MTDEISVQWTKSDFIQLCIQYKRVRWLLVANLFVPFLGLCPLLLLDCVGAYVLYTYLVALKVHKPLAYLPALFIPFVSLLLLLVFLFKGHSIFKDMGIKVGIAGPQVSDIEKLPGAVTPPTQGFYFDGKTETPFPIEVRFCDEAIKYRVSGEEPIGSWPFADTKFDAVFSVFAPVVHAHHDGQRIDITDKERIAFLYSKHATYLPKRPLWMKMLDWRVFKWILGLIILIVIVCSVGPACLDEVAKTEFDIGLKYYTGNGVTKDNAKAAKWFEKPAKLGFVDAQINLGALYYKGEGIPRNYAESAKWYHLAADHGDVNAQKILGGMYASGEGVTQDYAESAKWVRKAAYQGLADAQFNMGGIYHDGKGVPKDYAESAKWYRKAADQGSAKAQELLGEMYASGEGVTQDYVESAKWVRKAADQGLVEAQLNLGFIYHDGKGIPKAYGEAVKWYGKAADQGSRKAQESLGVMYEKGEGIPQDYTEAQKFYLKAAEQGSVIAQAALGSMYSEGTGVSRDYVEAEKWLRKAAEQGDVLAQFSLGDIYYQGQGMPLDYAEALKWFRKAANQGNAEAQASLGIMYDKGEGVAQDDAEAVKWLEKSSEQGDPRAKIFLAQRASRIYESGSPTGGAVLPRTEAAPGTPPLVSGESATPQPIVGGTPPVLAVP